MVPGPLAAFPVYAEGSRDSVEKTARQLEQFDASLRAMQGAADPVEARAEARVAAKRNFGGPAEAALGANRRKQVRADQA